MRLIVQKQDKKLFCVSLPTALLVNHISIAVLRGKLKKNGINIKTLQIAGLCNILKEYRCHNPEWVLVEAHTASGEYVKIEL